MSGAIVMPVREKLRRGVRKNDDDDECGLILAAEERRTISSGHFVGDLRSHRTPFYESREISTQNNYPTLQLNYK